MTAIFENQVWKIEQIQGKLYFETILNLFEILNESNEDLRVQTAHGLTLYPYKNCETETIIVPGHEFQFGSLPSITHAIACALQNLPWSMPHRQVEKTVKQEMVAKRAEFDIRMGANVHNVVQKAIEKIQDIENAESSDAEDDSWNAVRENLGETNSATTAGSDAEQESESESEAQKDVFSDEEPDENDLDGYLSAKTKPSTADRGADFFSHFGRSQPEASGLRPSEQFDPDDDIDDKFLMKKLASMQEKQPETQNKQDDAALQEWNGKLLPVVQPQNVKVSQNGKIVERNDFSLGGRSAKDAMETQTKIEQKIAADPAFDPFSTRKTMTQIAKMDQEKAAPQTVADELANFNLPPSLKEQFSKQRIEPSGAAQGSEASDALPNYPQSIDEIMHMAAPFKSSKKKEEPAAAAVVLPNDTKGTIKSTVGVSNEKKPLETEKKMAVPDRELATILRDQGAYKSNMAFEHLLKLCEARTTQMQALVDANRATDAILKVLLSSATD